MKLTKRMKNAIIQRFFLQTVVFFVFWAIIAWYIYPHVTASIANRKELEMTQSVIRESQSKGISYEAFRQSVSNLWKSKDAYIRTLLQNTTPEFFSRNFLNTTTAEYDVFLKSLTTDVAASKNDPAYIEKQTSLSTILPVYSDVPGDRDANMNDFDFVNSMENLLYTFNLSSQGEIGVGNIVPLETDEEKSSETNTSAESDLSEKIYMIPLNFDITGQKSDVLDFIHYFENVGKISIEDGDISIYNDNIIQRPLEGESYNAGYNIYKHQVAEIQNISFQVYPDSSAIPETGDLFTRLKQNQWREKMQATIDLVFYVVGIPEYQMEEFIAKTQQTYGMLKKEITTSIQKYSQSQEILKDGRYLQALQNLRSLDVLMNQLDDEMKDIQKTLKSSQSIEQTYTLAYEYMQKLLQMQQVYETNVKILTLQNDNAQ